MASESGMTLYWGSGSAPCWRVMLVLAEKGLGYENKMLSFGKKEHKGDDILRLNPRGQLPVFVHGDLVINESMATCEYLEAAFKGKGTVLIPEDFKQRVLVLQRTFEAQNVQTNCITEVIYFNMYVQKEYQTEEEMKKREDKCRTEVKLWEGYMEKMGDKSFVAGKNFSMADCVFFPFLAFLVRMGLDLKRYPHLAAYYNMVAERPSVKQTWPPHWNESEGKDLLKNV